MLYFDNFFNSPTLVEKVFNRGIYCLSTVWSDRKSMTIMKKDKDVERGDVDFQYAINIIAVKWFDNRWMTMVATCLEECNKVSTVTSRIKGQNRVPKYLPHAKRLSKITDRYGWVDLLVQKTAACKMDHKSSGRRYYLRLLFDLMDISVVDSHAIYRVFYPKRMESLDFKTVLFQNWYV